MALNGSWEVEFAYLYSSLDLAAPYQVSLVSDLVLCEAEPNNSLHHYWFGFGGFLGMDILQWKTNEFQSICTIPCTIPYVCMLRYSRQSHECQKLWWRNKITGDGHKRNIQLDLL